MNKVVVVESPAKAKTINKYLGPGYTVLASYGHVRDLPAKDGSVKPDEDFAMAWEVDARAEKNLKGIAAAVKDSDTLYLATDPDREGEAISWHVLDVLRQKKALKDVQVKRVVFNEITKSAVTEAMSHPREIDELLVNAYLARRALDYLVGFTLSPVLWRKLPGSRSAGRVQSVALRLICERESEIERFKAREYWTVEADFRTDAGAGGAGAGVTAQLTHLGGKKLDKFDIADQEAAERARAAIAAKPFDVWAVEKKKTKRHPFPPFTTSTLQQEASRKLGFSAKTTMQIAQRLYEGVDIGGETVGLITYMRTDGIQMANEAIGAIRSLINRAYGADYLPPSPRVYKNKVANAQEAHEAIRPTDVAKRPEDVYRYLDKDQFRLYELIWKRAVACQMESAVLDQVAVDFAQDDRKTVLRATGATIAFDGFLKLYREDRDDPEEDEEGKILPPLQEGQSVGTGEIRPLQHFTQPPPRYTEASLVKKLEELGIGRPSTYASIISVLQDRDYVKLDAKRFIPEDRGRLVIAFLESFFTRYVQYNFTADLENQLDDITNGQVNWKAMLRAFWKDFTLAVAETKDLRVSEVLDKLNEILGPHFFPDDGSGKDPFACPVCGKGRLSLKLGKFGAFIGCSDYPECRYTRPLAVASVKTNGEGGEEISNEPKALGTDEKSGLPVTLRKGPYGFYVQLGEAEPAPPKEKGAKRKKGEKAEKPAKPKRVSLPRDMAPDALTLERALKLLELPRLIGQHPETKSDIVAGIGRFGPYLKHGDGFKSLPKGDDILEVGINRAVEILAQPSGRGGFAKSPAKSLGDHPADAKPVTLRSGRYGHYVSHGKLNATLTKDLTPETITLDQAVALLAAKAEKTGGAPPKRTAAKGAKKASPKAKKAAAG